MTPAESTPPKPAAPLPAWAQQLIEAYESGSSNQFLVCGNVHDRMLVPGDGRARLTDLKSFLLNVLLPRFDVVLSYDLGTGIRVEKGGQIFSAWPNMKDSPPLPRAPRAAIEMLTHYFRYCANLSRLQRESLQVACIVLGAELIAPAQQGVTDYDLGAMATLIRDWASEDLLSGHTLATFIVCDNLHDLHPLIANNLRSTPVLIPLPAPEDIAAAFGVLAVDNPGVVPPQPDAIDALAQQLSGATLGAVERTFRMKAHARQQLSSDDIVTLKKAIVENDSNGLIEFLEPKRTLDNLYGLDRVKEWVRQDIALWKQNDIDALPKGYLICGPVGTGKTFLVECLAGEAGVPMIRMKNFRDKWVGSTEGNLEKIFRLIHALGRCYVFVDEADQALGRRDASANDSGLSGRVYSMIAEEMGSSSGRGRVVWILASSRPDLIEVDLKRPGRIDVRIPLFPTATPRESFDLIRTLCRVRGMAIPESSFSELGPSLPLLLTPGAAENLAVRVYRVARTTGQNALEALNASLKDYRNPVPRDVMETQIRLAVREASDVSFVPPCFLEAAS